MNVLLSLLILAATPAASIDARYPQAVEIYHNSFDESADRNYDDWPDDWTRRRGAGFPHYVKVRIASDPQAPAERCLRIDLNGGAVLAQSPPLAIQASSSYVLEVALQTQGLVGDEAYISLTFLNAAQQPLQTARSPGIRDAHTRRKVRLGPVATEHRDACYAVIGLHLAPGTRPDLSGVVLFGDVWLASLPRMALATNQPSNWFTSADVEIACRLSGFSEASGQLVFELSDALGKPVDRYSQPIEAPVAAPSTKDDEPGGDTPRREAVIRWRPRIETPGFYRARVAMLSGERLILERDLSLAVMPAEPLGGGSEFGWSLPRGAEPVSLAALPAMLRQAHVGWIKFPLWFGESQRGESEGLIDFVEQLGDQGIEIVGLLDTPPDELRVKFGNKPKLTAADLFAPEPEVWYPSLEPVMTQLSMKVRRWQLGSDDDTSLTGYPDLRTKVGTIKKQLNRIGQDLQLGLGWRWIDEMPADAEPWSFVTLSADPALTAHELSAYLPEMAAAKTERWVAVPPLARSRYSTATRATDLASRLLAAKKHGATRIFVPQPFDTEHGLLNDDGSPGELLGPWQIMASALAGTEYLGSIELPGGSRNEVFGRGDRAVMVLWNAQPTAEPIDLASDVEQMDLWGRRIEVRREKDRQWVEAGPLPTIVRGLNLPVARAAMSLELADVRFPSVFGVPHATSLSIHNWFPRGASGKVRFVLPDGWQIEPRELEFKLAAGEQSKQNIQILFPFDANSGSQQVRFDVEMAADRSYRFSVSRRIQVGLGDVTLTAESELADNGELIVKQRLHNHTDELVSFRCDLFASNRRRLRTQVFDLGRGEDVQTYRLPAGQELIGQVLWIRAEELQGTRVLSHRFRASE